MTWIGASANCQNGVLFKGDTSVSSAQGHASSHEAGRLARSVRGLAQYASGYRRARAGFKSLSDPWADTTTPHGGLMVTVLGGLAEFERHLILARTDEGRKRAQARGVRFGRKLKLTKHQREEALARREAGEALVEIASGPI